VDFSANHERYAHTPSVVHYKAFNKNRLIYPGDGMDYNGQCGEMYREALTALAYKGPDPALFSEGVVVNP
jgi:hypothetical protein